MIVPLLLGIPFDTVGELAVARVAGVALIAFGLACWLARNDGKSSAAKGLIVAMLFYNAASVVLFTYFKFCLMLSGFGLWPVILLHSLLAVWCFVSLNYKTISGEKN